MTHALHYGTAVFEGIRGNWNADDECHYLFRMREHFERLHQSAKVMMLQVQDPVDRLCEVATELVERGNFAGEDVYIRPLVYTASEVLGVRLHNVECDTLVFVTPFPAYLPEVARCHTSTWRRVDDTGIPPRAKVTGIYANSALAKTEANLNGFDEAIMLNADGHVSEGSGENIFVVRSPEGELVAKRVVYVCCGSYLAYIDSYAEEGMMKPGKMGSPRLRLNGNEHDLHVSV